MWARSDAFLGFLREEAVAGRRLKESARGDGVRIAVTGNGVMLHCKTYLLFRFDRRGSFVSVFRVFSRSHLLFRRYGFPSRLFACSLRHAYACHLSPGGRFWDGQNKTAVRDFRTAVLSVCFTKFCALTGVCFLPGKDYFLPVEPKPPAPRAVSESVSLSSKSTARNGVMTIWAMRSPFSSVAGSDEWLWSATMISPR